MTDFLKAVAYLSSTQVRDFLTGMSYAYDPIPKLYNDTFCKSDFDALVADLEPLYLDWWQAHYRLIDHSTQNRMETF